MDNDTDQLLQPIVTRMDNFARYGSASNLSDNSSISGSRPPSSIQAGLLTRSRRDTISSLRSGATNVEDDQEEVRFEEMPPGKRFCGSFK